MPRAVLGPVTKAAQALNGELEGAGSVFSIFYLEFKKVKTRQKIGIAGEAMLHAFAGRLAPPGRLTQIFFIPFFYS